MRWFDPLLAFALVPKASPVEACKCGMMTSADVARQAVFAGNAVEYLVRPPGGSARWNRELNAATRFVVDFAREFPSGASVVVMSNHYSNCSPWFQVGDRHLVVAGRVGLRARIRARRRGPNLRSPHHEHPRFPQQPQGLGKLGSRPPVSPVRVGGDGHDLQFRL